MKHWTELFLIWMRQNNFLEFVKVHEISVPDLVFEYLWKVKISYSFAMAISNFQRPTKLIVHYIFKSAFSWRRNGSSICKNWTRSHDARARDRTEKSVKIKVILDNLFRAYSGAWIRFMRWNITNDLIFQIRHSPWFLLNFVGINIWIFSKTYIDNKLLHKSLGYRI